MPFGWQLLLVTLTSQPESSHTNCHGLCAAHAPHADCAHSKIRNQLKLQHVPSCRSGDEKEASDHTWQQRTACSRLHLPDTVAFSCVHSPSCHLCHFLCLLLAQHLPRRLALHQHLTQTHLLAQALDLLVKTCCGRVCEATCCCCCCWLCGCLLRLCSCCCR